MATDLHGLHGVVPQTESAEDAPAALSGFPEVRIDRRFVILQQGREFILSDGLLDGLHQLSGGYFSVESRLEQLPNDGNGQLAVCSALVTVLDPDDAGRVLRSATGIGDASPASVNRMIGPHLIRMAETRAVSRALRVLLNVGAVAFEELGPPDDERRFAPPPTAERQAAPPERTQGQEERPDPHDRIQVQGQIYTRDQVWATYQARMLEARRAGLAVPDDQNGLKKDAPLSAMVAASQEVRKRLTARNGTDA